MKKSKSIKKLHEAIHAELDCMSPWSESFAAIMKMCEGKNVSAHLLADLAKAQTRREYQEAFEPITKFLDDIQTSASFHIPQS